MRSKKLRDSARGQDCAFGIAGVCNGDNRTTVLCHLPSKDTGGMGFKSTDLCAAYGCSDCHDAIDNRKLSEEYQEFKDFYNGRALIRTLTRFFELDLITIKGAK